jgi:hypothetical protein
MGEAEPSPGKKFKKEIGGFLSYLFYDLYFYIIKI